MSEDFVMAKAAVESAFSVIESELKEKLGFDFTLSPRTKKTLRYNLGSAIVSNIIQERKRHSEQSF